MRVNPTALNLLEELRPHLTVLDLTSHCFKELAEGTHPLISKSKKGIESTLGSEFPHDLIAAVQMIRQHRTGAAKATLQTKQQTSAIRENEGGFFATQWPSSGSTIRQ